MGLAMLADVLSRLPTLLASLDPSERPGDGLQLMSCERPFEPNPMVPTLLVGLDGQASFEEATGALRRALPTSQPLWLLKSGGPAKRATLAELSVPAPDVEAVFVPALAPELAERSLSGLRYLVHRLRAPGGCPWDREQTHESLVRYVLEEAYEVADAIRHDGPAELAEELGDLLFQILIQAELAEEAGKFTLNDVVERLSGKLVRRHPHVFGDLEVASAAEVARNWEHLKGAEKSERTSTLDGLPRSLPALAAAQEIQRRLKRVGFDWPDRAGVDDKLDEELAELRSASSPETASAELGDVLFILSRLGLDLETDAEESLRGTNRRVASRFRYVEERVRERGVNLGDVPIDQLSALWNEAKSLESV